MSDRPHLIYLAWGFPPAAKSCAYRLLATANSFFRAGWDVTVLTLSEEAWRREHGLDHSLVDLVESGIEVIRLPLFREDLETDIRRYSRFRAQRPKEWLRWSRRRDERDFPEPVFGRWLEPVTAALFEANARRPADLVLTSAAPYTFFAPARALHRRDGVPFVLDYRDAWAVDIIGDRVAFEPDSRRGEIETDLMASMTEAWFVNTPIRDAYAARYADRAADLHVVRNGADLGGDRATATPPAPGTEMDTDAPQGLVFGYLGTVTFSPQRTTALCDAWRLARTRSAVVARSRLEFRGHIGAGSARGANAHATIIAGRSADGISFGGPVPKSETADLYASWDVLLLTLVGSRYVTSGKVYDYVASGLPIVSVLEPEHAATEVLDGYPLWTPAASLDVADIADAFVTAAERAVRTGPHERAAAAAHAARFERYAQIQPAVRRLTQRLAPEVRPRSTMAAPPAATAATPTTQPDRVPAPGGPAPADVAVIAAQRPSAVALAALHRLSRAGHRVTLITREVPAPAPELAGLTIIPLSRNRSTGVVRSLTRHITAGVLGQATVLWAEARRHQEAGEALASADVIAAIDPGAVYAVWQAGRHNHGAVLRNGVAPLVEHLSGS